MTTCQIDKNGYRLIKVTQGSGTRRGLSMILEHRFVAEQTIGRKLLKTEIVHHINGVKLDNRSENLQILSRAEHIAEHASEVVKSCSICKASFTTKWGHRQKYCSDRCSNRANYISRSKDGYFQHYFKKRKLEENRTCKTCGKSLGLAHRNRDFCSDKCDPWH